MSNNEDEKAAEEYRTNLWESCEDPESVEEIFLAGIAHARRWHKYPEEKPPITGDYITYYAGTSTQVLSYSVEGDGWNILYNKNRQCEIFDVKY